MRIIYMGTPDFAVAPLKTLVDSGFNVVAVVTGEDKPQGRGRKVLPTPVKEFALEHGIPVLQPAKLKDEAFLAELKSFNADLQVVVAFRMLPEVVWAMPKLGTFNLHAALLPQYRGAAPINWAVINGETKTGVTTFFLDKDIDTGRIMLKQEVDILPEDNAGTIHDKLMVVGSELVKKTVEMILSGDVKTVAQSELISSDTVLKPAPKIFKEDCRLDFSKDGISIKNLVRGLSPYPAAFTTLKIKDKEMNVKVFEVGFEPDSSEKEVGKVITDNKNFIKISCQNGYIQLLDIQLEGKKRMKTEDFLRGVKL
ncbi:MAG: methionyl-tRNA formyltransferase [Bacteroidales bacterium]|nr:methionyl-tRNA formyltransferase [Bacteroidales bacterium]MBR4679181.1 methionyl-tRNA formyltransferase [Bacteroidales bacterium]